MFKQLYKFFSTRKLLLSIIIVIFIAILSFFASNIKLTEDISDMIPLDKELERFNFASQNIKMNDKIILNIYLKDTLTTAEPQQLVAFADSLAKDIENVLVSEIKEIRVKVDDDVQEQVYDIFQRNLPIYLTDKDYLRIDSLLTDDEINNSLKANLKNLISPAGMVTKKFITADPLSLTPIALKRLKSFQTDDNYEIFDSHILTKDRKNLLIFISSVYNSTETAKNKAFIDKLTELINKNEDKFINIQTDVFGAPVIAAGNAQQIKDDIILTVSIALLFLFIFISLFYKRFYVFFIIFLPAVFGAISAIAIIYFLQAQVSAVSLGIGSVLVGISIDYSLHIFTHVRSKNNISDIFGDISLPILLSSLTTASAFFSLLFVSSGALRDLGLFAGISVIVSAIFALIVLPHFIRKNKTNNVDNKKVNNYIEKFTSYNFHQNKYLILGLVAITIASFFYVNKVEFESDLDKMNYMNSDLKLAEKKLNKISNIAYRTMYLAAIGDNTEDALKNNEEIETVVNDLYNKGVIKSFSFVNPVLISDSLQKLRINKWNNFWTNEKKKNLKEKLIFYGQNYGFKESAFNKFYNYLDTDFKLLAQNDKSILKSIFLNELLTENNNITTVVTLLKLKQEDKVQVYKVLQKYKNVFIVDKTYFTTKVVKILKRDFDLLVKISLSVVFLILLLYFGRIELTIITFLPMFFSWIVTLGIMGFFGFKFTIFNIVISTFIFGLGIDYSIFIMQGLLQEYRYGTKTINSYKTSVLLSGVTTVTGIGVLIFAKHPALQSIAFLSVIGIVSVISFTYILQPLLFNFLVKQGNAKRTRPITALDFFFSILIITVFIIGSGATILFWLLLSIMPLKTSFKKILYRYWLMYMSKLIIYIPLNVRKKINNPYKENFKKPVIIVANHQAHIDIPMILMLYPKIIVLTNDWVQNNILYGKIIKYAEFIPISSGLDTYLPKLQQKVKEGYSILIYPEGTRSKDLKIKRFHKGAFYISEKLNLDILPIVIQGAGHSVPKGEPFLKSGSISVNILKRQKLTDFGKTNKEQAKNFRKFFSAEYDKIVEKYENVDFYKNKLISNYIYKTPVLENYFRVKIRLEDNYRFFDSILPKAGIITDIGCGYGFLAYMLNFVSPQRKVYGYDYDCQKINTANNNISKNDNLIFECADVIESDIPISDAFIINDVLHYMPKIQQKKLIEKVLNNLAEGGILIIRDGNTEMQKKHKGTVITEIFSTKLLKFNKTNFDELHFTSMSEIKSVVEKLGFNISLIDNTVFTSNQIYVISKNEK